MQISDESDFGTLVLEQVNIRLGEYSRKIQKLSYPLMMEGGKL